MWPAMEGDTALSRLVEATGVTAEGSPHDGDAERVAAVAAALAAAGPTLGQRIVSHFTQLTPPSGGAIAGGSRSAHFVSPSGVSVSTGSGASPTPSPSAGFRHRGPIGAAGEVADEVGVDWSGGGAPLVTLMHAPGRMPAPGRRGSGGEGGILLPPGHRTAGRRNDGVLSQSGAATLTPPSPQRPHSAAPPATGTVVGGRRAMAPAGASSRESEATGSVVAGRSPAASYGMKHTSPHAGVGGMPSLPPERPWTVAHDRGRRRSSPHMDAVASRLRNSPALLPPPPTALLDGGSLEDVTDSIAPPVVTRPLTGGGRAGSGLDAAPTTATSLRAAASIAPAPAAPPAMRTTMPRRPPPAAGSRAAFDAHDVEFGAEFAGLEPGASTAGGAANVLAAPFLRSSAAATASVLAPPLTPAGAGIAVTTLPRRQAAPAGLPPHAPLGAVLDTSAYSGGDAESDASGFSFDSDDASLPIGLRTTATDDPATGVMGRQPRRRMSSADMPAALVPPAPPLPPTLPPPPPKWQPDRAVRDTADVGTLQAISRVLVTDTLASAAPAVRARLRSYATIGGDDSPAATHTTVRGLPTRLPAAAAPPVADSGSGSGSASGGDDALELILSSSNRISMSTHLSDDDIRREFLNPGPLMAAATGIARAGGGSPDNDSTALSAATPATGTTGTAAAGASARTDEYGSDAGVGGSSSRARGAPSPGSAAVAAAVVAATAAPSVYTRARVDSLKEAVRQRLGDDTFGAVYAALRASHAGAAAAGAPASRTALRAHLSRLVGGSRAGLAACDEVDRLVFMEGIVVSQERVGVRGSGGDGGGGGGGGGRAGGGGGPPAPPPLMAIVVEPAAPAPAVPAPLLPRPSLPRLVFPTPPSARAAGDATAGSDSGRESSARDSSRSSASLPSLHNSARTASPAARQTTPVRELAAPPPAAPLSHSSTGVALPPAGGVATRLAVAAALHSGGMSALAPPLGLVPRPAATMAHMRQGSSSDTAPLSSHASASSAFAPSPRLLAAAAGITGLDDSPRTAELDGGGGALTAEAAAMMASQLRILGASRRRPAAEPSPPATSDDAAAAVAGGGTTPQHGRRALAAAGSASLRRTPEAGGRYPHPSY